MGGLGRAFRRCDLQSALLILVDIASDPFDMKECSGHQSKDFARGLNFLSLGSHNPTGCRGSRCRSSLLYESGPVPSTMTYFGPVNDAGGDRFDGDGIDGAG